MKIALTGASGLVGRALLPVLRAQHQVVTLGRRGADMAFDLEGPPPALGGFDALVHAGFAHVPGRYRGGEGDDPAGFIRRNQYGSERLFDAAARDGVAHLVFLSSRAVYGTAPPGTRLDETRPPQPDTLYGQVKWAVEQHLRALPAHSTSLRATGVYAPGPGHKWQGLFADYLAGRAVAPRVATEVHGADLARAVLIALEGQGARALNVSDLVLDRHDLLAEVGRLSASPHAPPPRADAGQVCAMSCAGLRAAGWAPGGMALLRSTLAQMLAPA